MILVVDKTVSARAAALREKIFSLRCPCAVCASNDIGKFMPTKIILTFADVLDDVRRSPVDSVFALVIGKCFINSALQAACYSDEESAVAAAIEMYTSSFTVGRQTTDFGVMLSPGVFLSFDFMEIYGNLIPLSQTECVIVKYLAALSDERHPISAQVIASYCSRTSGRTASNKTVVHISNINAKIRPYYGDGIIRSKTMQGYYCTVNTRERQD